MVREPGGSLPTKPLPPGSAEILNRAPGSVAPKLRAPDTPQAAFDLFTSTSRQTTSASQVTSARKSGLTPRILICRVENGSDEHSQGRGNVGDPETKVPHQAYPHDSEGENAQYQGAPPAGHLKNQHQDQSYACQQDRNEVPRSSPQVVVKGAGTNHHGGAPRGNAPEDAAREN